MADGDDARVAQVVFVEEVLHLTHQRRHRVEADSVHAAGKVLRQLRLRKAAFDHHLAFGFLRQRPQSAHARGADGHAGHRGDAESAQRDGCQRQLVSQGICPQ